MWYITFVREDIPSRQFRTELVKKMSENNVDASQFQLFQTIFLEILRQNFRNAKRLTYNKQRNLFIAMVRKTKKKHFSNLNVRNITDKQFSKTVKPFFSIKVCDNERIPVIEEEKVVSEDKEVAETF